MKTKLLDDLINNVRGAVYIPARAYNSYQMWSEFDKQEISRDMQYAKSLNLNSLRLFVDYHYWCDQPHELERRVEQLLCSASEKGVRIMPVLFEDCGREPSVEAFADRNPQTAVAIKSPGTEVTSNPEKWTSCFKYIEWFMDKFGDDKRLLAIEVMNEPHILRGSENLSFARAMFKRACEKRGSVPLTIGCMSLEHNLYFMEYGLDILQYHDNFPTSIKNFEGMLYLAKETQKILGKPVWISEWQRLREGGPGWDRSEIPTGDIPPKLATLAPSIHKFGIGNFFWSLMLKPAYLTAQRPNGTFNGIFHEDGAVYSLDDARSVSGNKDFLAEERMEMPIL